MISMMDRREFLKRITFVAGAAAIPGVAASELLKEKLAQEIDSSPIFRQKTLEDTSALDRIGHRRLVLHIQKMMEEAIFTHALEHNDHDTRSSIANLMASYMEHLKGRKAFVKYRVLCDEDNNFVEHIENKVLVLEVAFRTGGQLDEETQLRMEYHGGLLGVINVDEGWDWYDFE